MKPGATESTRPPSRVRLLITLSPALKLSANASAARAVRSLETVHFDREYWVASPSIEKAANGDMKMNAQATKLQAAENELKQLMSNVTQAMEKAQDAIGRIAPQAASATTETESTASSR
jgi:hypothetical protein